MSAFTVYGGVPLVGDVTVSGSKNAALPILLATLVTRGVSVIRRVPDIGDVRCVIEILSSYGARVSREGSTLTVDTRDLHYAEPSGICSSLRASTYLIGASLGRFGRFRLSRFGGCSFSPRPIDLHLLAAETLGARRSGELLLSDGLCGADIRFPIASVGATVNALIMASVANGRSVIRGFAREPHVLALADFLTSAGASITFFDDAIVVEGRELVGGDISVIGDMIEAGSYLCAALITGGSVTVHGVSHTELSAYLDAISDMGASVTLGVDSVTVSRSDTCHFARITAAPYPAFPTDLQPILAATMAALSGGEIIDTVFPSRFGYLDSLAALGVVSSRSDGRALLYPSSPVASLTCAPDLRGGMACVLIALAAHGGSRIENAEAILRGYESPTDKLRSLGAHVDLY
jgi:UDP-N-acetylglucosamine 1-carboxyvinyltransferase